MFKPVKFSRTAIRICAAVILQLTGILPTCAQNCIPPPQGLVSWWPGDGNANDLVGLNHGQVLGGVTFVPGFVGDAFSFNGIDGYFNSTTTNMPIGSADRTLEMWVKFDSILPPDVTTATYFEAFFAGYGTFGSNAAAFVILSIYQPPYSKAALNWSQWGDGLGGPLLLHDSQGWHHIAVTNGGRIASVMLYLDGVPVARCGSGSIRINTPIGTTFFMGRIPDSLGDIRRFHGQLDEVSIYSRALMPGEIAAIFGAGKAGKCKPN